MTMCRVSVKRSVDMSDGKHMIFLLVSLLALFNACNEPEDMSEGLETGLPELVTGINDDFRDAQSPEELDFSMVGYRWSDVPIPEYPVGRRIGVSDISAALAAGEAPDTTAFIEKALSELPDRTALLLEEGEYHIHRSIIIRRNNIVLRGEGAEKTRIIAAAMRSDVEGEVRYSCVVLGGVPSMSIDYGTLTKIIDSHVPAGAMYCNVDDAGKFSIGDRVQIQRPASASWISAIRMDCIDDPVNPEWPLDDFNMEFERVVTGISGNRLYFDAPIPMDLDAEYGTSRVYRSQIDRISECGVENLSLIAEYDPSIVCTSELDASSFKKYGAYECDENHARNGVLVRAAEHCWVKGVTGRHFIFSTVSLQRGARNITVSDCHSLEPRSLITGSRRYAFAIGLAELCLVKDCTADKDRHMFVTPSRSNGPNVFLRCVGTECYSNAGPHCWWATYVLYDNVIVDSKMSVEDVGGEAVYSSHGWQGANHVLWNCSAPIIVCQSPWVTGRNWAWGCTGQKQWGSYFNQDPSGRKPSEWTSTDKWRPDGEWYPAISGGQVNTECMPVNSLFESQLQMRHASGRYIMGKI